MTHLSPAQNARLRKAMKAYCNTYFNGKPTPMALAFGIGQPTLTRFFQGGGASLLTAQRFADKLGKSLLQIIGPVEADPKEGLELPPAGPQPVVNPPAAGFLLKLKRYPQLAQLIEDNPGEWSLFAVLNAMYDPAIPRDLFGVPTKGWEKELDRLER